MARIGLISIVALASVLIVQNCCVALDLSSLERYLDLPSAHFFDQSFDKNIHKALLELHVEPDSDFGTILNKIQSLAKSNKENQATYECLDIVCGYAKRGFPYSCAYHLKSIIFQVKGESDGELGKLNNFLTTCSKNYFSALVKSNINVISESKHTSLLDNIFKGAFEFADANQPGLKKDAFLAERLANFKLGASRVNIRKMVDAAKGLDKPSKLSSKITLQPLFVSLDQACVEMQYTRYHVDLILLFKTIKGEELNSNILQKLVEYQRICRDWQNPSIRNTIIANLEDH